MDSFVYIILFGRFELKKVEQMIGKAINVGWTVGEEVLYLDENEQLREEDCVATEDSCLLAIPFYKMESVR